LVCYRKYGHNEGDEPAFTKPGMYEENDNHPSIRDLYAKKLLENGSLSQEEADQIYNEFEEKLNENFRKAKDAAPLEVTDKMIDRPEKTQSEWTEFPDTTCSRNELEDIAIKL